jgi:hypothetical protein
MELVPFNPQWADSGSKLDLHAIYQRGDVIGTFPVRRHNDFARRGWTYITLATAVDASKVAGDLRALGVDVSKLQSSYEPNARAAFKVGEYLNTHSKKTAADAAAAR